MNQYLLLRDNKQTGPYSKEELIEKGLKKYDLVWLEGRSAAWRYPCEFDELKPYAPEVEEQPYDRFYKKPGEQTAAKQTVAAEQTVKEVKQPVQTNTVQVEEKPVAQPIAAKQVEVNTNAKHIYVTMPVGKAQTAATQVTTQKEEKPQQVQQQSSPQVKKETPAVNQAAKSTYLVSEEDDELNSAMLKGYNSQKKESDESNTGFLSDYESRKAAYQTTKKTGSTASVNTAAAIQPKKAEPVAEKKIEPVASSRSQKKELKDLFVMPRMSGSFFQDNKTLTRSLLAAVLILGGVVIGLVINSGKHQPDSQVLETLVKEIREQKKDKNEGTSTAPATGNKGAEQDEMANNDNLNNYNEQPPASNNNNISSETSRHAIIKKENNTNAQKPISVPVSNTEQQDVEAQPAVIDNKDKGINQETIEKARRNIYDLVGVEASQFKVGLLGGISDLDITISNNSLYSLDQVAVEIKYYGPEKKLVKTQTLVFNHVPAGKQRTLEAPSTRRGITIDYSITGINSKALGLAQAGN